MCISKVEVLNHTAAGLCPLTGGLAKRYLGGGSSQEHRESLGGSRAKSGGGKSPVSGVLAKRLGL